MIYDFQIFLSSEKVLIEFSEDKEKFQYTSKY
jgi:hypothetical protein